MKVFKYNKNSFMVIALTFTSLLGFPVVTPALPAVRDALNISTENIGWVMAAYSAPGLIFIPLFGLIADKYGKKKVLFPSLFLFGISGAACAFAQSDSLLFLLRFMQGIGASALGTLNVAMAADYFKNKERVKVMGSIGAMQNIGAGLLPVIGGVLATVTWYYPFTTSLIAIPLGIYIIFAMDEVRSNKNETTISVGRFIMHAWSKVNDRIVIEIVFLTGGFIFIGFGAFITYLPMFLKDTFNSPPVIIGIILGSRSVMGAIMASQLLRLSRFFSYRTLIFISFIVLALSLIIIPFTHSQWMLIISATLYGISFGILRPSLQYLLLDYAPEDLRTTFASTMNFGMRISQTISPLFAGFLMIFISYKELYLIAGILSLAMAIYVLNTVALSRKPHEE